MRVETSKARSKAPNVSPALLKEIKSHFGRLDFDSIDFLLNVVSAKKDETVPDNVKIALATAFQEAPGGDANLFRVNVRGHHTLAIKSKDGEDVRLDIFTPEGRKIAAGIIQDQETALTTGVPIDWEKQAR